MSTKRRGSPSGPEATEKIQVAVDHGTITAVTVDVATVTVTDARTTDTVVAMSNAALKTGLFMAGARVSAAGEVEIYVGNPTAGNITTGTVTYDLTFGKFTS